MADLGKRNALTVLRQAPPGFFLDGGDLGEILLPGRYIPSGTGPGSVLDVFLYRDSEDRLVATTQIPIAMVGEFALLRVVGVKPSIGAFLDWGLDKDLLLPRREQLGRVQEGDLVMVHISIDEKSDRIIASARINRALSLTPPAYTKDHPVKLMIAGETPLGYNAIVDDAYRGLIYHTDLAGPLQLGEKREGFVRSVREDGKLDVALDRTGFSRIKPLTEQIMDALQKQEGTLPFHDKSTPEVIRATFGVSKKAFKQAIGILYNKKRIQIEPDGIRIAKKT